MNLASLFGGRNPFSGLQGHMKVAVQCAGRVPDLMDALIAGDEDRVRDVAAEIDRLEQEADTLKNELRLHLPKSLFMPVDRRDLLEILTLQDSIADTAQDIAGLFIERPMSVPDFLRDEVVELTRACVAVAHRAGEVVGRIDELLEVGFRGPQVEQVERLIGELNREEDETDRLGAQFARQLFGHEAELDPVSVLMWYRVGHWIGDIADYAEKVGDRILLIIAS